VFAPDGVYHLHKFFGKKCPGFKTTCSPHAATLPGESRCA